MFARADDHAFLQMIWAIDALQDDRSDVIAGLLTYPKEAAQSPLVSPYAIQRWELETLLIPLFLTPKQPTPPPPTPTPHSPTFPPIPTTATRLPNLLTPH